MYRFVRVTCALSVMAACAVMAPLAAAQDSAPPEAPTAQSPAQAAELVELLASKSLTSFAVRDPDNRGRFVAVLHIPNVQLMVVSAAYERTSDIDYRIYHKEYQTAYMDLNAGMLSTDKFFVQDTGANGLVLDPAEDTGSDLIRAGETLQTFDGEFADPRKRNDERISQADYYKAFSETDARYARLLTLMITELRKSAQ
jgi:hypothetical protein